MTFPYMKRTNSDKSWQITRGIGSLLMTVAMALVGCSDSPEGEANSDSEEAGGRSEFHDWPIFRGDPELQGECKEDLAFPLELVWTFEPVMEEGKRRLPIDATPVISGGVVYVGNKEGRFFAINLEDGSLLWEFKADGPVSGPAAVFGDQVFFGDNYGLFYALKTADGSEAWRFETDDQIEGGVNVLQSDDGLVRVFFGSNDFYLYCLNAESGEMLWKHETQNMVVATPSIVNSGGQQAVTFGGCDGILHIVPANGEGEPRMVEVGTYIAMFLLGSRRDRLRGSQRGGDPGHRNRKRRDRLEGGDRQGVPDLRRGGRETALRAESRQETGRLRPGHGRGSLGVPGEEGLRFFSGDHEERDLAGRDGRICLRG